jgi:hypothetical protein
MIKPGKPLLLRGSLSFPYFCAKTTHDVSQEKNSSEDYGYSVFSKKKKCTTTDNRLQLNREENTKKKR